MRTKRPRAPSPAASRILDVAERLVQVSGFNGFSYADVAAELGVTKASLHYHFPGKAELGEALIVRYASRFGEALTAIDAGVEDAMPKLQAYAGLYSTVLRDHRMCLCGMLAAEYQTLPEAMQRAVLQFFDANRTWLARVLSDGRTAGSFAFAGEPREAAEAIVGGLEGAMLIARPYDDAERFDAAASRMIAGVVRPVAS